MINIGNQKGMLTVSSREIATNFSREHKNVLRDIHHLLNIGGSKMSRPMFIETKYQHHQNKQWYKEYLLTRDGFCLLVMGFTGSEALDWKLKYIDAFNAMESCIKSTSDKAQLLIDIYNGGQTGIVASKTLTDIEIQDATKPLLKQIEDSKPLVEFAEKIQCTNNNILIRELAKIVSNSGVIIGEKRLYRKLREMGFVFQNTTEPTQHAVNMGILIVDERVIETKHGFRTVFTTKVTPKGQIYITNKIV